VSGCWRATFPTSRSRTYVQVEEPCGSLILEAGEGVAPDEQADLPLAHAQALLAVSHGQVESVRTKLSISSHEIQALHFVRPVALDLVAIAGAPEDRQDLPPVPWFGPEVSIEPASQRRRLALDGAPDAPEVDVTNAALNSLLDLLEDQFTTWPVQGQAAEPGAPAADVSLASDAPVPATETEADAEVDHLGIEDAVIRELARALQSRRCG
jgi:hypothetical protein